MVGGKGINDPALVKTLCEGTADAIDWLDANGMSLHNVSNFGGAIFPPNRNVTCWVSGTNPKRNPRKSFAATSTL